MLFEMLLFRFNSQDLYEADEFLGPFVFTLFIYFVVFICCTMFISIVNDGFRHIRSMRKTTSNQDILLFIIHKIKLALGIDNEIKHQENESLEHRDALEQLSDKIDQLMIVLDKLKLLSSKSPQRTTAPTTLCNDLIVEDV